jgi:hypothetical protein
MTLKPCPFCGTPPVIDRTGDDYDIICTTCRTVTRSGVNYGAAAKAWNTRDDVFADGMVPANRQAQYDDMHRRDAQLRSDIANLSEDLALPTAERVLRMERLFEAYPELRQIAADIARDGGNTIGQSSLGGIRVRGASDQAIRSVALHEMQHQVQSIEGTARGGSPREFTEAEVRAASRTQSDPVDNGWGTINTATGDDLVGGRHRLYQRLAGEVEARAVQARRDMTADERRARPPWLDYDVPEGEQIVRFYGREALSVQIGEAERRAKLSETMEACPR